ncbi:MULTISPECIES: acyl-CoA dehydrogenase family protein [unclassified Streptomyces]|uniref:acyl-CoA dehydrogenase family protein n=1 Tax=unclassified Streptomyces TaxID=2593676 RepID=UPI003318422E
MAEQQDFQTVVEAVRNIVGKLRDNGTEAEEKRRVPDANIALLEQAGVFRMAVPRAFGGLGLSVAEQAAVVQEIGRGCPSTGWDMTVWTTGALMAALYPDETQAEVFAGGSTRVSIGFAPTGKIVPTEGGYLLNGSWSYNSGCHSADWDCVAVMLERPDGTSEEFIAIVPMSELSIVDDWDVTAGSGTGSATSTAKDVFVPARRVAGYAELMTGTTGDRWNTDEVGRGYGIVSFIMAQYAAMAVGVARGAYELFLGRLPGRGITYTSWDDQSLHPLTQVQVATAANKIDAAEALSATWLRLLQERADAGEQPTDTEKAIIRGRTAFAGQLAKEAVELLFSASGASVIKRNVPFQRYHRDILGFSLHALAQANVNLELQGRVLLGLAPDTDIL